LFKKGLPFQNLSKGTKIALDDYLNKRSDDNPYLFISHHRSLAKGHLSEGYLIDMFKRLLKTCGMSQLGITPHCLRHSAATFNLIRGGSLAATRSLMRHVDIKSTLVYQDHINRIGDDSEARLEAFILREDALDLYIEFIRFIEADD